MFSTSWLGLHLCWLGGFENILAVVRINVAKRKNIFAALSMLRSRTSLSYPGMRGASAATVMHSSRLDVTSEKHSGHFFWWRRGM